MALQITSSMVQWPWELTHFSSNSSTMTLTTTNSKRAFIFRAETSCTVTAITFRVSTVTNGDERAFPLKVSIQSVDGSGDPSGTILGTGSNGYDNVACASADDNTWKTAKLDGTGNNGSAVNVSLTAGTQYAIVFELNSGHASDSFQIVSHAAGGAGNAACYYYVDGYAGSWTKTQRICAFWLTTASGTQGYMRGVLPFTSNTIAYNSGTGTNDEYAIQFTTPNRVIRASGISAAVSGAGGTITLILSIGGTEYSSEQIDLDLPQAAWVWGMFSSAVDIPANTSVIISVRPDTTTNVTIVTGIVSDASWTAVLPPGTCTMKSRLNSNATWTDNSSVQIPLIGLVVDTSYVPSGGTIIIED